VHPPQEEADADVPTVSPPLPLVTKPQADIILKTLSLLHDGQSGFSAPNTSRSKFFPQPLQ